MVPCRWAEEESVELQPAAADGTFPDHFYATTNLPAWVRVKEQWIEVEGRRWMQHSG
jgi:hypothetical protein